jgi:hypothetical protein
MPDRDHFEPFVVYRVDRDFGLDALSRAYRAALLYLARDFRDWFRHEPDVVKDYGFASEDDRIYLRCELATPKGVEHLGAADDFEIPPFPGDDRAGLAEDECPPDPGEGY